MRARAYYNEVDPFAAGVLKRRIADGSLPPGEVDERDVRTVQAADLAGYAQVHLFAGIGGFGLAARLAGWPDERPLWTGGYPCQPFSVAGLRRGTSDDRYLWPDCARLLGSVAARPAWCLFENVDGHRDLGLDRTLFDLEALGYAGRPFWIPACAVEAPHERMRVWIVGRADRLADAAGDGRREDDLDVGGAAGSGPRARQPAGSGADVALAYAGERQLPQPERRTESRDGPRSARAPLGALDHAQRAGLALGEGERGDAEPQRAAALRAGLEPWRDAAWLDCADGKLRRTQPGLGLLAHGIPDRVARLRALGNAIVPQVAARILQAILRGDP